jgi:hypothetical protein
MLTQEVHLPLLEQRQLLPHPELGPPDGEPLLQQEAAQRLPRQLHAREPKRRGEERENDAAWEGNHREGAVRERGACAWCVRGGGFVERLSALKGTVKGTAHKRGGGLWGAEGGWGASPFRFRHV